MAVGTMDFVDATAWASARTATRDTTDAAAARARFGRDLDAATAKDDAQARNAAERGRSADAAALGRADRAKAADLASADAKAARAASQSTAATRDAPAAPAKASPHRTGFGTPRPATASTGTVTRGADTARPTADAPSKTNSTSDDGKADPVTAAPENAKTKAEAPSSDAKAADPKAPETLLAAPTVALILDAPPPALTGRSATPPAAAAAEAASAVGIAGTAAGAAPAEAAGRPGAAASAKGDDAVAGTDAGAAPATKADLFAALTDVASAGPGTPDPVARTQAASSGQASAAADKAPVAAAAPPVPLGQVPMTIGLRSLAGSSEFQIRLDPLELGRVDVTLDIDKDKGTVTTHLVVERVETLAMLQRDAGSLQQALAQAGLDPSQGGITMSLRSDGGSGGEAAQRDGRPGRGNALPTTPSDAAVSEVAPLRTLRGLSGLDIRI